MSANNYIYIEEIRIVGEKPYFEITHRDYDTDSIWGKKEIRHTLRGAVKRANNMLREYHPVEYGIHIDLIEEK